MRKVATEVNRFVDEGFGADVEQTDGFRVLLENEEYLWEAAWSFGQWSHDSLFLFVGLAELLGHSDAPVEHDGVVVLLLALCSSTFLVDFDGFFAGFDMLVHLLVHEHLGATGAMELQKLKEILDPSVQLYRHLTLSASRTCPF